MKKFIKHILKKLCHIFPVRPEPVEGSKCSYGSTSSPRTDRKSFITTLLRRTVTATILIGAFLIAFFWLLPLLLSAFFGFCIIYIWCVEWKRIFNPHSIDYWLFFPLYPLYSFILLIMLNQDTHTRLLLLIMIALTSTFDTGAYLTGSLIGKHLLVPKISPKKTWEGLCGGIIFCFTAIMIICWHQKTHPSLDDILIVTIITSALALFGDLFESWLKRKAGIKDSGSLLPGHGGLLDRFDSMLFVVLFFYWCKDYLMHIFV